MASQWEEASVSQWQQRHTQALRDTAESLQLGRATAHTLSMQAEQLGRSERMLDETQATVDLSKRVLRGMTWRGWLYNKFSASPEVVKDKTSMEVEYTKVKSGIAMGFICPECKVKFESPEQLGNHYGSVHERQTGGPQVERNLETNRPSGGFNRQSQQQSQVDADSVEDIHEQFLRDLEPQLTELKEQSLALGSALDTQNEQLDRLDSKIGQVHHDMKRVGIQANKIAGRRIAVMFRFRCAFQEVQTGKFLRDVDGDALLSADVVVDGCTFRAYTLGDDSDVWGFQSEKSSQFLGINRYGNLKVRGGDFNSYEQFLVESKSSTPIFCLSSYFGLGGWVAVKGPSNSENLTIIRGTPENRPLAAHFKIVNLEDGIVSEVALGNYRFQQLMKFKVRVDDATAVTAGTSLKNAEIAVQSSISVREQHKVKLRALLSKMAPQAVPNADTPGQTLPTAKKAVKGKPRKARQSVDTRLPESTEGKEIHVLGDLLLLIRASSVDVIDNIQKWREVVHQGLPRPYIYENENYLLKMCEDLNFLDQVGDLVEWLGFRLVRNPFIVTETLDDVVSSRLARNVHEGRSLKYWSSTSWKLTKKVASKACQSNQTFNYRWKKQSPPPPLVKPLASIRPEDDVVDGSQIANAQEVLLDEEAFHGRLLALRATQEYVARDPSVFELTGTENSTASATIYDAISTLSSQLRSKEFALSLVRRECTQVERSLQDLRNQMGWTELHLECDCSKNHRVWECRNKYRQEALKTYNQLTERLERCLMLLKGDERRVGDTLDKDKERLRELRIEKDKQRAATRNGNQLNEATKLTTVRPMADKRDCKAQTKKKSLQACSKAEPDFVREFVPQTDSVINEDIAVEIQNELGVIEIRKMSGVERDLGNYDADYQLEKKRQLSIYQKRARLEQQTRILEEKELLLDHRRAENVAMKWEDKLARTVEREARRKTMLKSRKARKDRVASRVMFKCMHEMNGKRFLISVYTRNARGYDLEGLRIVAYDPRSSASYTMVMTLREFYGLGYGRTSDGLEGFCKWLCLLYEKRRRQYRLAWSGTPCPPPLRVRENDQSLVCIHKEGVKMRPSVSAGYSLVAVYLRTDEQCALRFVAGSGKRHEFLLTEHIVFASCLLTGSDLDVQWKASGQTVIVWKHHADVLKMQEELCPPPSGVEASGDKAVGPRIYSSEIVVKRVKYLVHLYDTDETTYTVELIPQLKRINCGSEGTTLLPKPAVDRLSLHKRDINPYDVHLSSSSFADLLSLFHFEQSSSLELKQESSTGDDDQIICSKWKATVSPKWTNKLANYVRVLRLVKYACKVGGVFCFVVVYVVQQKTEFRAHLLLELTCLAPTLSSSFSLGGAATRQSLRIALSDYLRCTNASRRFGVGLGSTDCERESGDECPSCLKYDAARAKLYANDIGPEPETTLNYSTKCSSCALIQYRRLHAIKELIIHAGAIDPQALEFIYHGYCGECSTLAPPIVLVVGSVFSKMMHWLLPLLEHYFASFDCRKTGCMSFNDGSQGHSVSDESAYMRETILQTLARDQVVVLFNADSGVTVASANSFVQELHWWLYPHFSELPCHMAYVVGDRSDNWSDDDIGEQDSSRDHDLVEALQALNRAACQVAELPPVYLNDDGNEEDHASAFDAYLVAEAVLVEATRVLLHPDYAWQKPRKIVGASSWSTACSYLLDPVRFSADLQRCDLLGIGTASVAILEAYFAHAKWPRDYPDVRPVFYGMLAFMMHVQHVCQIVGMRSGSLQSTSSQHHGNEGEMAAELEVLALNTSVIDCSAFSTTMETSSHGDFNGGNVQDTPSIHWL